ncbi:delta endotoxin C-terminal domain-containing protein, partial [Bacillus sp. C30]|uniref:delta endotoxin C-terminal domain-containing protein n=1 Tax=Bacillus sp. C30 TaxID=1387733 RepID=UPI00349F5F70
MISEALLQDDKDFLDKVITGMQNALAEYKNVQEDIDNAGGFQKASPGALAVLQEKIGKLDTAFTTQLPYFADVANPSKTADYNARHAMIGLPSYCILASLHLMFYRDIILHGPTWDPTKYDSQAIGLYKNQLRRNIQLYTNTVKQVFHNTLSNYGYTPGGPFPSDPDKLQKVLNLIAGMNTICLDVARLFPTFDPDVYPPTQNTIDFELTRQMLVPISVNHTADDAHPGPYANISKQPIDFSNWKAYKNGAVNVLSNEEIIKMEREGERTQLSLEPTKITTTYRNGQTLTYGYPATDAKIKDNKKISPLPPSSIFHDSVTFSYDDPGVAITDDGLSLIPQSQYNNSGMTAPRLHTIVDLYPNAFANGPTNDNYYNGWIVNNPFNAGIGVSKPITPSTNIIGDTDDSGLLIKGFPAEKALDPLGGTVLNGTLVFESVTGANCIKLSPHGFVRLDIQNLVDYKYTIRLRYALLPNASSDGNISFQLVGLSYDTIKLPQTQPGGLNFVMGENGNYVVQTVKEYVRFPDGTHRIQVDNLGTEDIFLDRIEFVPIDLPIPDGATILPAKTISCPDVQVWGSSGGPIALEAHLRPLSSGKQYYFFLNNEYADGQSVESGNGFIGEFDEIVVSANCSSSEKWNFPGGYIMIQDAPMDHPIPDGATILPAKIMSCPDEVWGSSGGPIALEAHLRPLSSGKQYFFFLNNGYADGQSVDNGNGFIGKFDEIVVSANCIYGSSEKWAFPGGYIMIQDAPIDHPIPDGATILPAEEFSCSGDRDMVNIWEIPNGQTALEAHLQPLSSGEKYYFFLNNGYADGQSVDNGNGFIGKFDAISAGANCSSGKWNFPGGYIMIQDAPIDHPIPDGATILPAEEFSCSGDRDMVNIWEIPNGQTALEAHLQPLSSGEKYYFFLNNGYADGQSVDNGNGFIGKFDAISAGANCSSGKWNFPGGYILSNQQSFASQADLENITTQVNNLFASSSQIELAATVTDYRIDQVVMKVSALSDKVFGIEKKVLRKLVNKAKKLSKVRNLLVGGNFETLDEWLLGRNVKRISGNDLFQGNHLFLPSSTKSPSYAYQKVDESKLKPNTRYMVTGFIGQSKGLNIVVSRYGKEIDKILNVPYGDALPISSDTDPNCCKPSPCQCPSCDGSKPDSHFFSYSIDVGTLHPVLNPGIEFGLRIPNGLATVSNMEIREDRPLTAQEIKKVQRKEGKWKKAFDQERAEISAILQPIINKINTFYKNGDWNGSILPHVTYQ